MYTKAIITPTNRVKEIAFVLDRSGSMAKRAKQAIDGFNDLLESSQKAPCDARLTLVLFDHEYIVTHDGRPIQEVQKLDEDSYQPRGRTALYDAIGRTINAVGERLDHTPKRNRPSGVLIVILTDGLDNESEEFSLEQIKTMILQRETWEFNFLGAGQDAKRVAASLGIAPENVTQFPETPQGVTMAFQTASRVTLGFLSR